MQLLTISLVVGEQECLVFLKRASRRLSELVSLKQGSGTQIEEIVGVERIVAQEFKGRAMPLIRAGLRDDRDLAARVFAVFGGVGIPENVEFPNGVDAKQLLARSTRLHVVFGRAGILHAVQEKKILLRPVSGD